MKRIIVERGETVKIARVLNVSEGTVRNALKFHTEGEIPNKIRKTAIERGGTLLASVKAAKLI